MTQKIITLDPAEFDSILIQLKPKEAEHIKGELGIDVSKWQGTVIWDGMVTAGVGFAGIRATMGTRGGTLADGSTAGLDLRFARNWTEAKRVGVQRMAYHYFANNGVDPIKQVDNFLSALGTDLGELPPVLDVERAKDQTITDRATNTAHVLAWLNECERRIGIKPIIYTNKTAWDACTTVPLWSVEYKLWLAHYTAAPAPTVRPPWTECAIWQFTSAGSLAGTNPLDLNRWGPYP